MPELPDVEGFRGVFAEHGAGRRIESVRVADRRVLRDAVPTGRVPGRRSWLTGRRDDTDPACPRCGTGLHHGRVGGRGTFWCPECQPDGYAATVRGRRRA
jgi:formamidopyrimidine-DNA glycosylase